MPVCRLCGIDQQKLVKAHIIPRSLFKLVAKGAPYSVYFKAQKSGLTTAYKQAGIYDQNILCEECEARFSEWDKHGGEVISRPRGPSDVYHDAQGYECGFVLRDTDYNALRRFLLAVLWRASVSSLEFFCRVNPGPHEHQILNLLMSDEPLAAETYSSILIHPVGQRYPGTILPPWSSRLQGVRFYRLYFPDVIALIKADQRSTPSPFNRIQLQPQRENYMIFLPYQGMQEEKFYTEMTTFMRKHKLFGTKPRKT